jgi:hypothetical protein
MLTAKVVAELTVISFLLTIIHQSHVVSHPRIDALTTPPITEHLQDSPTTHHPPHRSHWTRNTNEEQVEVLSRRHAFAIC